MFVQMINVFENVPFHRAGYRYVVNETATRSNFSMNPMKERRTHPPKMNYILTQPYPARVRTHHHPKLLRHQKHAQHLAHARQPTAVDLAHVHRLCLQKLLEEDTVMRVFPGCDADAVWSEGASDGGVAENVVWGCGFFDKPVSEQCKYQRGTVLVGEGNLPRLNGLQTLDILHCFVHSPHLIRVNHQHRSRRTRVLPPQSLSIEISRL